MTEMRSAPAPTSTRWRWLDSDLLPGARWGSRDWQRPISPPDPQTPMVARAPCAAVARAPCAAVTAPLFHSLLPRLRCD